MPIEAQREGEGGGGGGGMALNHWRRGTRRRWLVRNTLRPRYPRERPNTHYTGVYVTVKEGKVAQRVGRGIALLFRAHGTSKGWVVSSTPRPHLTPGKDPVPILQEVGWASAPVWTGGKSCPHRDSIPDRPARSQSLYRLSYPTHGYVTVISLNVEIHVSSFRDNLIKISRVTTSEN